MRSTNAKHTITLVKTGLRSLRMRKGARSHRFMSMILRLRLMIRCLFSVTAFKYPFFFFFFFLHFWNQFPYFLLQWIVSPLTDSDGVSVAFVVDAEPPEPLVGGAARVPVLHPEVRCRGNDEKHQGSHAAEGAPSCQSVEHRGEAVGSSDLLSIQQLNGTQNGSNLH